jgi:PAS domain S-box-containing protein
MDPELLAAVDAAVLVLECQTGGRFRVEQINPAARLLLGGLAVAPSEPLPPALQAAWGKALAEAAGQGSAALPLFRAGPDCCLGGTARSLDATRVVATIRPALSAAEASAILDEFSEMVCRWRPDGTIYYCNAPYAWQCGLSREQVIGASLHDLTPGNELLQILSNVRRLSPKHPVSTYDHHIPETNGEGRWQEWIDRALLDGQGPSSAISPPAATITRRKRAEARLRRNEQRLRLALSAARQRIWEMDLSTRKGPHSPGGGRITCARSSACASPTAPSTESSCTGW